MNSQEIDEAIKKDGSSATRRTNELHWRTFQKFLSASDLQFDPATATNEQICSILKKLAFNVRKEDGDNFKESSLKSIWNTIAKTIQEKIYDSQGRSINIFEDIAFRTARAARGAKRSELQKMPDKRPVSATPLTADEAKKMIGHWGIDTPEGLNKTLFHVGGFALGARGNEQAFWRVPFFEWETSNSGEKTGRLFYRPLSDKSNQGGDRSIPSPKTLDPASTLDGLFIDLYKKVLSKRPEDADPRVILAANKDWKKTGKWYKKNAVGINTLQKWFKETASKIGINTNQSGKRFTNHAQRSTLATLTIEAGAEAVEAAGMTGHRSVKSLVPYVNPHPKRRSELKNKGFGVPSPRPEKQSLGVPSPQPEKQLLGVPSPRPEKQLLGVPSPRPEKQSLGVPSPRPEKQSLGPSPRPEKQLLGVPSLQPERRRIIPYPLPERPLAPRIAPSPRRAVQWRDTVQPGYSGPPVAYRFKPDLELREQSRKRNQAFQVTEGVNFSGQFDNCVFHVKDPPKKKPRFLSQS